MSKPITLEGRTFKSIKEAAEYYNLKYNTIFVRLRRGWTLEEAFELVDIDSKNKAKEITVEGKSFISIAEAARYYNLEYETVRLRLRNKGWSIEEAFELVKRKDTRNKEITVEGRTFKSIKEAAEYYNLKYNTIRTRIFNYGWSIEEAFELVPRQKR